MDELLIGAETKLSIKNPPMIRTRLSSRYKETAELFIEKAIEIENRVASGEYADKYKTEYFAYTLHSILSSVMALESYVNECLGILEDKKAKEEIIPCKHKENEHEGNPEVEKKICKIYCNNPVKTDIFKLSDGTTLK